MSKRKIIITIAGLAVAGSLAAFFLTGMASAKPDEAAAASTGVLTALSEKATVLVSITVPAVAEAASTVQVRTQTAGRLLSISEAGTVVAAGDIIATLDATENQRKLTLAQIQVQEAVINVQKAELNLKRAERSQQETQALHALGAASDEQLLTSTENLESARQAFRLSELAREKAGLVLEEAHYNVEAAKVRAPVAGTILSVESSAGAYVSANASVALVGDLSRLRMSAEVDEYDIMRLSSGLQVKIESDSAAIGTLTARLDQISPVAKIVNNISFFSVSALVANSEGLLRPGMTADMSIIIARDQGLTVPSNALTTIRGRSYLDVLVDGVPETRRVEAGADDGKRIVILSGLEEQDQVVLPQAASLPGLIPVATTTDKASTLIPVSIPGSGGGGGQ